MLYYCIFLSIGLTFLCSRSSGSRQVNTTTAIVKILTISRGKEPIQAVELRNTSEGSLDSARDLVQAANLPFAKEGVHLGPHFLNGIEIRAVGWKVQYLPALCLHNFPDGLNMVVPDLYYGICSSTFLHRDICKSGTVFYYRPAS